MRGLGEFQMGQMKHRDVRIFEMFPHLRSAVDLLERISSDPRCSPRIDRSPWLKEQIAQICDEVMAWALPN